MDQFTSAECCSLQDEKVFNLFLCIHPAARFSLEIVNGFAALDFFEGGFLNMWAMEYHFDAISYRCLARGIFVYLRMQP
jgi:hypothetical protein